MGVFFFLVFMDFWVSGRKRGVCLVSLGFFF